MYDERLGDVMDKVRCIREIYLGEIRNVRPSGA